MKCRKCGCEIDNYQVDHMSTLCETCYEKVTGKCNECLGNGLFRDRPNTHCDRCYGTGKAPPILLG